MSTLELSSYVLENPNNAYTTPSQNPIGCSTLRQEYCKVIDWSWKMMRRQLWTLTCRFCYGPRGQETPISQASKSLWIRKQALNIMVSMKLSISLSKDDFKYINFNESAGFQSVERAQDVFHASYLMEILQEDPCLKPENPPLHAQFQ